MQTTAAAISRILTPQDWAVLPDTQQIALSAHMRWLAEAHKHQVPPPMGMDWFIWMLMAGRGAGKTRCAAETLWWWAWIYPKTRSLVLAPTSNDVKFTCFEGDSGLINVIPPELVEDYNKQDHQIKLINGSIIRGISADAYERLRGPQWHFAWCDELAVYQYLRDAWDMMMFGLRLGDSPRVIVTTTPRHKDLIVELVEREGDDVVIDRATTHANRKNLAKPFIDQLERYKGTKLYEQEVEGKIIDLEDGKVVSRSMFKLWPDGKPLPKFEYIIQSYDCAFTDKLYNDPTAMTTWGVFKQEDGPMSVMLIDCWNEHLTYPQLKPKVIDEFKNSYGDGKRGKKPDLILVEDKAAGISLIQDLQAAYLPVRGWNPGRADKMQRLQISASVFVAGRVWVPESSERKGFVRDWAEGWISQLCSFPDSTRDDYVDSTTQALRFLKDSGWIELDLAPRQDDDDDDYVVESKRRVNPYAA